MDRPTNGADGPTLRLCYPPDSPDPIEAAAPQPAGRVGTGGASGISRLKPVRPAMTIRMGRPVVNAAPSFARPARVEAAPVQSNRNALSRGSLRLQEPAKPAAGSVGSAGVGAATRGAAGPARLRASEAQDVPEPPALNLRHDDPRWVLAVRTFQVMQGSVVRPSDRRELLRMAGVMGMDAFAANLVIAIVQDRARRGLEPADASQLLLMIPGAKRWRVSRQAADDSAGGAALASDGVDNRRRMFSLWWRAALLCGVLLMLEMVIILSVV